MPAHGGAADNFQAGSIKRSRPSVSAGSIGVSRDRLPGAGRYEDSAGSATGGSPGTLQTCLPGSAGQEPPLRFSGVAGRCRHPHVHPVPLETPGGSLRSGGATLVGGIIRRRWWAVWGLPSGSGQNQLALPCAASGSSTTNSRIRPRSAEAARKRGVRLHPKRGATTFHTRLPDYRAGRTGLRRCNREYQHSFCALPLSGAALSIGAHCPTSVQSTSV